MLKYKADPFLFFNFTLRIHIKHGIITKMDRALHRSWM